MARKVKKTFIKSIGINKPKILERLLSLEEVDYILSKENELPFVIDKKHLDELRVQRSKYESIKIEYESLVETIPEIKIYEEILD